MPQPTTGGPEPEGKPTFFNRPLAKDPIFWTGLSGMVVLGSLSAFRNPSGSPLNPAGLMASSIDAAVSAAFAWFLAGFLPALIRRLIRSSKRKNALKRTPDTTEPSWQQDPVDPARYRWWAGAAWSDVVAPPPRRGPNKVAWLLVPAFLIVLLAGWAGGLASSSPGTAARANQLGDAYAASLEALEEYGQVQLSPSNPLANLPAKQAALQQAVQAQAAFTALLDITTSQSQVGPFPSLVSLRAYDDAAVEFYDVEAEFLQRLDACSPGNTGCFQEARSWYEANFGDTGERLYATTQDIANEARSYGSAQ